MLQRFALLKHRPSLRVAETREHHDMILSEPEMLQIQGRLTQKFF
jgi:hypothetical protein